MLTATAPCSFDSVFETIPEGLGLALGQVFQYPNRNKFVQFVRANGAVVLNAAVKIDINFDAVETTELADIVVGVNDNNSEVSVTDNYYFFATIKGEATVLQQTGTVLGELLVASTADGELMTFDASPSTVQNNNLLALETNASGGTLAKDILIL